MKRRENDIVFWCFFCGVAGKRRILQSLGLTFSDLYTGPATPKVAAEVVATYDYRDADGHLVAQKVRTAPKGFWFRRPDPKGKSGWRDDLKGVSLGLYRFGDLGGRSRVYITEGEKAVDRLWQADLPATCGPFGAGRWNKNWSMDLWNMGCRQLVVLADNDLKGIQHAELVAATSLALDNEEKFVVRVVHFSDLPAKADVADFLDTHNVADLLQRIAMTHLWSPDSAERDRLERRRLLTRNRVRRHRANKAIRNVTSQGRDIRAVTRSEPDIRAVTGVTVKAVTRAAEGDKPLPHSQFVPVTQRERSSSTLQGKSRNDT